MENLDVTSSLNRAAVIPGLGTVIGAVTLLINLARTIHFKVQLIFSEYRMIQGFKTLQSLQNRLSKPDAIIKLNHELTKDREASTRYFKEKLAIEDNQVKLAEKQLDAAKNFQDRIVPDLNKGQLLNVFKDENYMNYDAAFSQGMLEKLDADIANLSQELQQAKDENEISKKEYSDRKKLVTTMYRSFDSAKEKLESKEQNPVKGANEYHIADLKEKLDAAIIFKGRISNDLSKAMQTELIKRQHDLKEATNNFDTHIQKYGFHSENEEQDSLQEKVIKATKELNSLASLDTVCKQNIESSLDVVRKRNIEKGLSIEVGKDFFDNPKKTNPIELALTEGLIKVAYIHILKCHNMLNKVEGDRKKIKEDHALRVTNLDNTASSKAKELNRQYSTTPEHLATQLKMDEENAISFQEGYMKHRTLTGISILRAVPIISLSLWNWRYDPPMVPHHFSHLMFPKN